MRKLLKVILPPVVAFFIFALVIKFGPFAGRVPGLSQIGNETTYGLMAYYRIFMPLLLLTAILTQLLIVMPLWRIVLHKGRSIITIFIIMCLLCSVLAAGLSYMIWDHATGTDHLISIFLFMSAVQVGYWFFNFGVLFLIDTEEFAEKREEEAHFDE